MDKSEKINTMNCPIKLMLTSSADFLRVCHATYCFNKEWIKRTSPKYVCIGG